MKEENERLLSEILNKAYPGQWTGEYKGIEGRKFRFDCANPKQKIAIEIEGGIWLGRKGGHTGCYRDWETDRKSTRLNSSH